MVRWIDGGDSVFVQHVLDSVQCPFVQKITLTVTPCLCCAWREIGIYTQPPNTIAAVTVLVWHAQILRHPGAVETALSNFQRAASRNNSSLPRGKVHVARHFNPVELRMHMRVVNACIESDLLSSVHACVHAPSVRRMQHLTRAHAAAQEQ